MSGGATDNRPAVLHSLREAAARLSGGPAAPGDIARAAELMQAAAAEIERLCRVRNTAVDVARRERAAAAASEEQRKSAVLALGLLWMTGRTNRKVHAAYVSLRDGLGGKEALREGIRAALALGHEADHPSSADWWAGKTDDREAQAGAATFRVPEPLPYPATQRTGERG